MSETPVMRVSPEMGLQYLDNNIYHWRSILRSSVSLEVAEQATHYVDAYQCVRVMFFGEMKPLEPWQESIP